MVVKGFIDGPGDLDVFEDIVPGTIKRNFYIYDVKSGQRGGHRHHKTWNIAICVRGRCRIYCCDGKNEQYFLLSDPTHCLVIEPQDWHVMDCFSEDAILLVLSNQYYDSSDYIDTPYAPLG